MSALDARKREVNALVIAQFDASEARARYSGA